MKLNRVRLAQVLEGKGAIRRIEAFAMNGTID